jgi:hypothetical protein
VNREMGYKAIIGAIFLLGLSIIMLVALPILVGTSPTPVGLTLTIITGVTALLSSLVLASLILNCLNLSDREEALGLPTGSVRAIIALSLIVIFAIMSIFMFQYMDNPVTTTTTVITTNSTIGDQNFTNSTTTVTEGTGQAMIDFTKTTLTTMGTLVVAIAAFYFGTRSVQVAKGAEEEAELFIDPSGTKDWKIGDSPIIIFVKPTPEDAAVNLKVDGDKYESVQRGESPNRYIYTPSLTEEKTVTLAFEMPAYSDFKAEKLTVNIKK